MSGLPAREEILQGMAAHLAEKLGLDASDEGTAGAALAMADAALGYFAGAVEGGRPAAGAVLMWAIYSALWEGKVPEAEIAGFFTGVNPDPARLFDAWRRLERENPGQRYTVALISGSLAEADILRVAEALYMQRPKEAPPGAKNAGSKPGPRAR